MIAGVVVLAVVLALVGLAVVAGGDSSPKEPATLPVLGAGSSRTSAAAPMASEAADAKLRVAPVQYQAGKLPGLADQADAWTLAPGGGSREQVAELADLLDVEGRVTKTETGWTVGTDARRLDVQDVAGLPWSLYETAPAVVEPLPLMAVTSTVMVLLTSAVTSVYVEAVAALMATPSRFHW